MRTWLAAFGIAIGTTLCIWQPLSAADVPLPDDIQVVETSGLAPEHKAWLGTWGKGKWDGSLPSIFIVEEIDPAAEQAMGVYAWGDHPDGHFEAGFTRYVGTLDGDVIRIEFENGARVKFTLKDETTLAGVYTIGNSWSKIKLRKIDLPAD